MKNTTEVKNANANAVNYKDIFVFNTTTKIVAKSYTGVVNEIYANIDLVNEVLKSQNLSFEVTKRHLKKFLPKTANDAKAVGIRFGKDGETTCRFYVLQYLYKCIAKKLQTQQAQRLTEIEKAGGLL